jgi:hypothetical protein
MQMVRSVLLVPLVTVVLLLVACVARPPDDGSTDRGGPNRGSLGILGSVLRSGTTQRELSVLSGMTSAYCGATCQDGYSAGSRGTQQCLNELPAAIPRVALNTLLEQGVRVLSTSEQRRMRMPDLPDPGVSWARWRVTCFYAAVLVEGRADVIDGFVQEYQRPIDMSPSAGADADDPFTRLGRAIEQLRGAFPSESQAPAPADSSSTTGMSSSNPDKPPAQESPVFTEQGLDLVRQVRVGMRQEETEAIMGTPVERAYERTAAVSFYCQTGGFSDDVVAIFFRAQYADRQALVSESPGVYTVASTLRYKVTLDDVGGETGDCARFVRRGGYRPPAWVPDTLR